MAPRSVRAHRRGRVVYGARASGSRLDGEEVCARLVRASVLFLLCGIGADRLAGAYRPGPWAGRGVWSPRKVGGRMRSDRDSGSETGYGGAHVREDSESPGRGAGGRLCTPVVWPGASQGVACWSGVSCAFAGFDMSASDPTAHTLALIRKRQEKTAAYGIPARARVKPAAR